MSDNIKNYYDILGIKNESTNNQIKVAFKSLALKFHPDKSSEFEDIFKNINEAYSILSDTKKREEYDDKLKKTFISERWKDVFGAANVSDLFSKTKTNVEKKGSDINYDLTISLHDYIFGITKNITISYNAKCPMCDGTGRGSIVKCSSCNGIGKVKKYNTKVKEINIIACKKCNGTGVIHSKCSYCNGTGCKVSRRDVVVNICEDRTSDIIQFIGYGNCEGDCNINGNLNVNIKAENDKIFKRNGNDLLIKYEIYVVDLIIGTKISVKSPYGIETVNIPAGTQPDEKIRIHKKGIKGGDLIIQIKAVVPMNISEIDRELYEQIRNPLFISDNDKITLQ